MATEVDRLQVENAMLELRVLQLEAQNTNIMACFHTIVGELEKEGQAEMVERLQSVLRLTEPVAVSASLGSSRQ